MFHIQMQIAYDIVISQILLYSFASDIINLISIIGLCSLGPRIDYNTEACHKDKTS